MKIYHGKNRLSSLLLPIIILSNYNFFYHLIKDNQYNYQH